jgi:hypothetical protein
VFREAPPYEQLPVTSQSRCRLEITVQDERVEVRAVGPDDGAHLVVDTNLREELGVA